MSGFFASLEQTRILYNKDMRRKTIILILATLTILIGGKLTSTQLASKGIDIQPMTDVGHPPFSTDSGYEFFTVIRIVDGDTIVINMNGTQEKIRLLGVDTPESVDPRKPVQCFGKEATLFTKDLLEGKHVRLESDSTQGNRDKYGRLLRYVFLPDGTFINRSIIAEGYGHEYTYRTPYLYRDEFKTTERFARELQKGLWSPVACNF